jgi:hypothetical protein
VIVRLCENQDQQKGVVVTKRVLVIAGFAASFALLCAAWFAAPLTAVAEDSKLEKKAPIAPVEMERSKLAGVDLPVEEEWIDPSILLEGKSKPRGEVLFRGEELIAEVYEDDALKMTISEPFPHDEYIYVLSGELILTDSAGVERTYTTGDSLVIPKGFTGIWQTRGTFRELVVIERKVYDATYLSE